MSEVNNNYAPEKFSSADDYKKAVIYRIKYVLSSSEFVIRTCSGYMNSTLGMTAQALVSSQREELASIEKKVATANTKNLIQKLNNRVSELIDEIDAAFDKEPRVAKVYARVIEEYKSKQAESLKEERTLATDRLKAEITALASASDLLGKSKEIESLIKEKMSDVESLDLESEDYSKNLIDLQDSLVSQTKKILNIDDATIDNAPALVKAAFALSAVYTKEAERTGAKQ